MRCVDQFYFGILLVSLLTLNGCQTPFSPFSGRSLAGVDKPGSTTGELARRPVRTTSKRPQQIFYKESNPRITEVNPAQSAGSLAGLNVGGGQIFTEDPRGLVGKYLDVKVVLQTASQADVAEQKDKDEGEEAPKDLEGEEKELYDSLPELAPQDKKKRLPKTLKVKIMQVLPNGDFLVRHERAIYANDSTRYVIADAVVPRRQHLKGEVIKTSDLVDVKFTHTNNGENFQQESYGWEDEYTMRLAGLNESDSRYASDMAQKKAELIGIRDRLRNRLISIGKERGSLAKTRSDVEKTKAESTKAVSDLKQRIQEKDETIAAQREELESIRNQESPGERRDGSDGE